MTYEEYLAKYGELTYRNVGVSMLPLIRQGRDTFTVRALHPGELCRRWDVVLYTRPPQSYVLHRIISVHDGGYDILGDNCVSVERNIPRECYRRYDRLCSQGTRAQYRGAWIPSVCCAVL